MLVGHVDYQLATLHDILIVDIEFITERHTCAHKYVAVQTRADEWINIFGVI